ncbi:uncharacterized protein CLUP02_07084 [Colletotrichum lupini]|uniref:Secreted protein n=1 Tax=Colletotrichum lupini TaxID=145971 RepID=A0A9Q8SQI8_9PEZI|nr:uncharacterized protein CLUP02_07084 [Colletotrichum lupini]UQC81598.1 hypothetical protein CLUP02_07084 [Colletotrichum lupini]
MAANYSVLLFLYRWAQSFFFFFFFFFFQVVLAHGGGEEKQCVSRIDTFYYVVDINKHIVSESVLTPYSLGRCLLTTFPQCFCLGGEKMAESNGEEGKYLLPQV